jgi:LysM repeat protein
VPGGLAILLACVVVVITTTAGTHDRVAPPASRHQVPRHRLPRYWTVRPGDTYSQIALKTGLTVAQLEAFNPDIGPSALVPGERLNLRVPPPPRPRPPQPHWWTVRPGQSFGSIAARTGINIDTLEALNPHLKPTTLQPGDRVRLRR